MSRGRSTEAGPDAGRLLAFDTATSTALVGVGDSAGRVLESDAWTAGHRHSEDLLARIDRVLAVAEVQLAELTGLIVGIGPGAFTGLRVGLATAKGLAHGLGIPLVGVSTGPALQAATPSDGPVAVLLPAGPSDRVLIEPSGRASLLRGGTEPDVDAFDPSWTLVAVDLEGRAPPDALALGVVARDGQLAALMAIGAERLRMGAESDLATLVPEYVTLPRGVRAETGEVAWSRDRA